MSESHCTAVHRGESYQSYAECTCGWRSSSVFCDEAAPLAAWHRLAVGETIDNPYLRAFLAPVTPAEIAAIGFLASDFLATRMRRDRFIAEYAWAIPTELVVRRLADLSPICDLGCGTGYWAKLLMDVGAKVIAVDSRPPLEGDNSWHRSISGLTRQPVVLRHFTDIVKGDAATFDVPSDHALMLCWPPYNSPMGSEALARYRGDRVIYVGEGDGGCTGDDAFHAMLDARWDLVDRYEIPRWDGIHDSVHVYRKRGV